MKNRHALGMEDPPPLSPASLGIRGNTPATRPLKGAGSAWRVTRWPCTERKQDLRGFFTDALVDALQGTASMGYRPAGSP